MFWLGRQRFSNNSASRSTGTRPGLCTWPMGSSFWDLRSNVEKDSSSCPTIERLADELGLSIEIHHLPPGTSKWNKIEHRLFSFITQNWRAKPLLSYRVIVELIGATT